MSVPSPRKAALLATAILLIGASCLGLLVLLLELFGKWTIIGIGVVVIWLAIYGNLRDDTFGGSGLG